MKGTTLLINEDQSVTLLENVDLSVYKQLKDETNFDQPHCTINNKVVEFEPVQLVTWYENDIDLDYGY